MKEAVKIEASQEMINELKSTIHSSYSGNLGCMCGCNGNYKYKSSEVEQQSIDRGYKITEDEVSDKAVSRKINSLIKLANDPTEKVWIEQWNFIDGIIWHETETRINAVYFKKGA
jgi:hypothetical protein